MKPLILCNPERNRGVEIAEEELSAYLSANHLACRVDAKHPQYVTVFDAVTNDVVTQIENGSITAIPSFRGLKQLAKLIRCGMEAGQPVAVAPSPDFSRQIPGAWVFVRRMEELRDALPDAEVLLPPGRYGSSYMFAIRPRTV